MVKIIIYSLAAAGISVFVVFATTFGAEAQNIEKGNGVVCDSPEYVEQVITLHTDARSAVEQINTESKWRVCEIVNISFIVGSIIAEASNDKGTWQIRQILVVGSILGPITNPVQPYSKYTAFLTSKAAPI